MGVSTYLSRHAAYAFTSDVSSREFNKVIVLRIMTTDVMVLVSECVYFHASKILLIVLFGAECDIAIIYAVLQCDREAPRRWH